MPDEENKEMNEAKNDEAASAQDSADKEAEQTAENEAEEATNKGEEASKEEPKPEESKQPTPEEIIAELNDKLLRLHADFDNYRKRMAREANETRERSKIAVITEFLPVYDFYNMAMKHAATSDDLNAIKQGMQMILNEFKRALDSFSIKEIPTEGKPFDPRFHEATKTEANESVPEGTIIAQWKPGYMMGERLIRPAMVVVSSGPAKPIQVEEEKPEEKNSEENADEKPADAPQKQ